MKIMLDGLGGSGIIGTDRNENRGSKTMKNKIELDMLAEQTAQLIAEYFKAPSALTSIHDWRQ